MESWMPFFIAVVAFAVVLQTLILAGMFVMFRRMNQRVEQLTEELRARVLPVLSGLQTLIEESRPHITSVVANAAEITNLARSQAQRIDRVMGEALERVRMQLAHVDQILTGTLETVEEAGSKFRRSVWTPVQSVAAIVRGIQTGLEFYRGSRSGRRPFETAGERDQQDENLFI
jgi:hypothetical protein